MPDRTPTQTEVQNLLYTGHDEVSQDLDSAHQSKKRMWVKNGSLARLGRMKLAACGAENWHNAGIQSAAAALERTEYDHIIIYSQCFKNMSYARKLKARIQADGRTEIASARMEQRIRVAHMCLKCRCRLQNFKSRPGFQNT